MEPSNPTILNRAVLSLFGGASGFALWVLIDAKEMLPPALYLAVFSFLGLWSVVTMLLSGPMDQLRAMGGAAMLAVPLTALISLAGTRYVVATDLFDDGAMVAVLLAMTFAASPFLRARLMAQPGYAPLFETAWDNTIRLLVSWLFVLIAALVLFLFNALLSLVEIDVISDLLDIAWVRAVLIGAGLGLGFAVVNELREMLSPELLLRLLRLLLVPLLVVVTVFFVALPMRGLSDLFGDFSTAGLLMGVTLAALLLISSVIERDDDHAARSGLLLGASRIMAAALPAVMALAIWAIVLRVTEHGWTPPRVLAMAFAAGLGLHALGYIAAAASRDWKAHLRQVNHWMALVMILIGALYLTPALNPMSIATQSQIARFQSEQTDPKDRTLWTMAHEWGKAGQQGAETLRALAAKAGDAELAARIEKTLKPVPSGQETRGLSRAAASRELLQRLQVRPIGAELTPELIAEFPLSRIELWLARCSNPLPDGRAGCVLLFGSVLPIEAPQAVFLGLSATGEVIANLLIWDRADMPPRSLRLSSDWAGNAANLTPEAIERVLNGQFNFIPSGMNLLKLGDTFLIPSN